MITKESLDALQGLIEAIEKEDHGELALGYPKSLPPLVDFYGALKEWSHVLRTFENGGEIIYTDAPVAYDGFGTTTLEPNLGETRRGIVRKVMTPTAHVEWQRMRYGSGMHIAATEKIWEEGKDLFLKRKEAK